MTKLAEAFVELRSDSTRFAAEARTQIGAVLNGISAKVGISADASGLRAQVSADVAEALAGQHGEVQLDADSDHLRSETTLAVKEAEAGQKIDVPIKADRSQLDSFVTSLSRLKTEGGDADVVLTGLKFAGIAAGAAEAAAGLSSLGAGAIGLVAALAPLTGLLGALPTALAGIGSGFAVFKLATGGIKEALGGMDKAEEGSGASAKSMADAHEAAAERVRSAQQTLGDAVQRQSELTQENARRSETALRALSDAVRRQADEGEQASRRTESANRTLEGANRSLVSSEQAALDAEEALTRARRDAARALEDLTEKVSDNALTEQEASLRLDQARKDAARSQHVDFRHQDQEQIRLDQRRAALGLAEAEDNLSDVQRQAVRDQEALNEAQAKGVDGSDQVIAAQKRQEDAQRAVVDSLRAVADAQRGIADTARENARAQADAARAVADAQRGVADASTANAKAEVDAARAVERATHEVEQALRAQEKAGESAGGAASAAKKAFDDLSPAAQRFTTFLHDLKPEFEALKADVAESFLPGLQAGIEKMSDLYPVVHDALVNSGRAFGDFFDQLGTQLSTSEFKRDFAQILGDGTGLMKDLGAATLDVFHGVTDVAVAAQPLIQGLGQMAKEMAQHFKDWAAEGRRSGNLREFFERVLDTTRLVVSVVGGLFRLLGNIGSAAKPLGDTLFKDLDRHLDRWNDWAKSFQGQNELRRFFDDALPPLRMFFGLVSDLTSGIIDLGHENMPQLTETLKVLRYDVLPVIIQLLRDTAPLAGDMTKAISAIFNNPSFREGFNAVIDVFRFVIQSVTWLIENIDGLGGVIGGVVAAFLGWKVIHSVLDPLVSGITGLIGLIRNVGLTVEAVTAAEGWHKLAALGTLFGGGAKAGAGKVAAGVGAEVAAGAAGAGGATLASGAAAEEGAAAGAGSSGLLGALAPALPVIATVVAALADLGMVADGVATSLDEDNSSAERFSGGLRAIPILGAGVGPMEYLADKVFGVKFAFGQAADAIGEFTGLWDSSSGKTRNAADEMVKAFGDITRYSGATKDEILDVASVFGIDLAKAAKEGSDALKEARDRLDVYTLYTEHAGKVSGLTTQEVLGLARAMGVDLNLAAQQGPKQLEEAFLKVEDAGVKIAGVGRQFGLTGDQVVAFAKTFDVNLPKALGEGGKAFDEAKAKLIAGADTMAQKVGYANYAMAQAAGESVDSLKKAGEEADSFRTKMESVMASQTSFAEHFAGQAEVTGEQAAQFFQDSRKRTEEWAADMKELMSKGLDTAFVKEIAAKGPDADAEVKGLLALIASGGKDIITQTGTDNKALFDQVINELNSKDAHAKTEAAQAAMVAHSREAIAAAVANEKTNLNLEGWKFKWHFQTPINNPDPSVPQTLVAGAAGGVGGAVEAYKGTLGAHGWSFKHHFQTPITTPDPSVPQLLVGGAAAGVGGAVDTWKENLGLVGWKFKWHFLGGVTGDPDGTTAAGAALPGQAQEGVGAGVDEQKDAVHGHGGAMNALFRTGIEGDPEAVRASGRWLPYWMAEGVLSDTSAIRTALIGEGGIVVAAQRETHEWVKRWFPDIGSQMGWGIYEGLTSNDTRLRLIQAGRWGGEYVKQGLNQVLHFGSPSREMARLGRLAGEGLAEGLIGSSTAVSKAAVALAEVIAKTKMPTLQVRINAENEAAFKAGQAGDHAGAQAHRAQAQRLEVLAVAERNLQEARLTAQARITAEKYAAMAAGRAGDKEGSLAHMRAAMQLEVAAVRARDGGFDMGAVQARGAKLGSHQLVHEDYSVHVDQIVSPDPTLVPAAIAQNARSKRWLVGSKAPKG